jgi:hypothetical protein
MNGNSFAGLAEYECIPRSKLMLMLDIHNDVVERQNQAMKK